MVSTACPTLSAMEDKGFLCTCTNLPAKQELYSYSGIFKESLPGDLCRWGVVCPDATWEDSYSG